MSFVVLLKPSESVALLKKAEKREADLFIKLAMQHALIKHGQFDVEEQLVARISENGEWDRLNRGYHLVRYGDWKPKEPPPHFDPGGIPWNKTMTALLRNIQSPFFAHMAMRRVALLTAKRLMETRENRGPLCVDVLNCIDQAIHKLKPDARDVVPGDFLKKVDTVYRDLEKCWEMISDKSGVMYS